MILLLLSLVIFLRCQRFLIGNISDRLVGDTAYKGEHFMLKVIPGENLPEHGIQYNCKSVKKGSERKFNDAICRFRAIIEQVFGQIKRVFHSFYAELRYFSIL